MFHSICIESLQKKNKGSISGPQGSGVSEWLPTLPRWVVPSKATMKSKAMFSGYSHHSPLHHSTKRHSFACIFLQSDYSHLTALQAASWTTHCHSLRSMSHSPWPVPKRRSPLRTVSFPTFVDTTLDKKLDEVSVGQAKMGHEKMGHARTGHAKKIQKGKSRGDSGRSSSRRTERQPPQSPRLESFGDDFDNGDSFDKSPGSTGSEHCRNDIWGAISKETDSRQRSMEPFSSRPTYGPDEADIPERAMTRRQASPERICPSTKCMFGAEEAERPERAMDRRQQSPEMVSISSKSIHDLDDIMKQMRARLILKYARATLRATTPARAVSPPFTPFWPRPEINLPSVRPKKRRFGPAKRATFDGSTNLTKSARVRASRPRRRSAIEVIARVKPKLILKRPDTLTEGSSPSPLQTDVALQAMSRTGTRSGSTDPGDEGPALESQPTLETEDPEIHLKQWKDGLASCWKDKPSSRKICSIDPVDKWPDLESQPTLVTDDPEVHFKQWKEGLASCWKERPSSPKTSSPEPVDEWPVLESQPTLETEDPEPSPNTRFTEASGHTKSTASTVESPPARDPPPTILDSLYEGTRIWSDEDSLSSEADPNTHESLEIRSPDPTLRRCKLVRKQTQQIVIKKEKFDWMNRPRPQASGDENIDPRLKNQPYVSMRALPVVDGKFRVLKRLDKGS